MIAVFKNYFLFLKIKKQKELFGWLVVFNIFTVLKTGCCFLFYKTKKPELPKDVLFLCFYFMFQKQVRRGEEAVGNVVNITN